MTVACASPSSERVGTLGNAGDRFSPVTARATTAGHHAGVALPHGLARGAAGRRHAAEPDGPEGLRALRSGAVAPGAGAPAGIARRPRRVDCLRRPAEQHPGTRRHRQAVHAARRPEGVRRRRGEERARCRRIDVARQSDGKAHVRAVAGLCARRGELRQRTREQGAEDEERPDFRRPTRR